MALTVGELQVQLEARTAEFKAGLTQAEARLTRFEKKSVGSTAAAGKAFLGLKGILVGLVGVLGAVAAFQIGKSIVSSAVKAAGSFQQFEVQLQNFLGSQEEANAAVEDFTRLAAKTPFSVSQVVQAGTALGALALGNRGALNEMTLAAINLAAVTGIDLPAAASNLQRAFSTGIASADLFRERGVKQLVEAIQGVPDLTKEPLARQKELLLATFGGLGTFGDAGEKLSLTLNGALSNIGDAVEVLQARLGQAFAPAIIAGARNFLIPLLERMQVLVVTNHRAILNFAFNSIKVLVGFLAFLVRGLELSVRTFIFFRNRLLDARAGVAQVTASIAEFLNLIGSIPGPLRAVLSVANPLFGALAALGSTISDSTVQALKDVAAETQTASNEGSKDLENLADGAAALGDEVDAVAGKFKKIDIEKFAGDLSEAIKPAKEFTDTIKSLGEDEKIVPATTKQAASIRQLTKALEKRNLKRLGDINPLLAERQEIENQIRALRELEVNDEGRVLRARLIKQLLADQADLTERIASGDFEVADLSETVSGAFSKGFAQAVQGEGGGGLQLIGTALFDRSKAALDDAFKASLTNFETGFSKVLDGLGSKISGLFEEDGLFSGFGDKFGGILKNPKLVQGVLGIGGALLQGLGGGDVRSAASGVTSAVTSSQQVRGVVAGPTSIGIGEVKRGIQESNKELERQGLIQIRLQQAIEANTRGASNGAPSPNDPAEVALSTESESLT